MRDARGRIGSTILTCREVDGDEPQNVPIIPPPAARKPSPASAMVGGSALDTEHLWTPAHGYSRKAYLAA